MQVFLVVFAIFLTLVDADKDKRQHSYHGNGRGGVYYNRGRGATNIRCTNHGVELSHPADLEGQFANRLCKDHDKGSGLCTGAGGTCTAEGICCSVPGASNPASCAVYSAAAAAVTKDPKSNRACATGGSPVGETWRQLCDRDPGIKDYVCPAYGGCCLNGACCSVPSISQQGLAAAADATCLATAAALKSVPGGPALAKATGCDNGGSPIGEEWEGLCPTWLLVDTLCFGYGGCCLTGSDGKKKCCSIAPSTDVTKLLGGAGIKIKK